MHLGRITLLHGRTILPCQILYFQHGREFIFPVFTCLVCILPLNKMHQFDWVSWIRLKANFFFEFKPNKVSFRLENSTGVLGGMADSMCRNTAHSNAYHTIFELCLWIRLAVYLHGERHYTGYGCI